MDHVAEIDDAAYAVRQAGPRLDEHVVVVAVVVDHSHACGAESGERVRLESLDEPLDDAPKTCVLDFRPVVPGDAGRVLQVPVKVAMGARVVEVVQGAVEQAEVATETPQQTGTVGPDASQRFARHPGQHASQVDRPVRTGDRRDRLPFACLDQSRERTGEGRVCGTGTEQIDPSCQMIQGRVLELEHVTRFEPVGDLQYVASASRGGHAEVLVPLARQRVGGGLDAEPLGSETLGSGGGKPRSLIDGAFHRPSWQEGRILDRKRVRGVHVWRVG